jgi:hypothetical protein
VWSAFAAPAPAKTHAAKHGHVTVAAQTPAATQSSTGPIAPVAKIGGGPAQADGTGPAVVATFAALLGGFALFAGRWLRLSFRRRAHPPKHALQEPAASGGHRRPRGFDDDWTF